jgi:hypothetical protein
MTIILYIFLTLASIGLALFIYGIITAKEVDPHMPFIRGDYDPSKDPSKKNDIVE